LLEDGMAGNRGEVFFEFIALGNSVRVSAICSITGLEVQIIGPAKATRRDLEQLALKKLQRRLAETSVPALPVTDRGGFTA
jgi:hypothetical protein